MEETKMNRRFGTKWFTFYAKVRPWLGCLASIAIIVDFFIYIDVYASYWWLGLYFIAGVAQSVLAIMVFIKSKGDYEDFVRFVNGVLIFETIFMAYQQAVQQYIKNFESGTAIIIALIILVAGYFLWYRLNIKYFKKRILRANSETTISNFGAVSGSFQNYDSNEASKVYSNYNVWGNDIKFRKGENENTNTTFSPPKARFCRICGNKLLSGSRFCVICGTKIITDEPQERAKCEVEERAKLEEEERVKRETVVERQVEVKIKDKDESRTDTASFTVGENETVVCSQCNCRQRSKRKVCWNCGAKFEL